jgi:pyridoxamine 5'-phosphate oxidase-like protein
VFGDVSKHRGDAVWHVGDMAVQSWPAGSVLALATHGDGPHVIPVSAALRTADGSVWLALAQTRESLARLRADPRVAVLAIAAGDVAVTLYGSAAVVHESLAEGVAGIRVTVTEAAQHGRTTFVIDSGVIWHWTDEQARARDADVNAALVRLAHAA